MIAGLDVDYRDNGAVAACVLFRNWDDETATAELVKGIDKVEPYQPGQFYKRELPCLLSVLWEVTEPLAAVVVDGYVWLQDEETPGLGGHLYQALGGKVPVVGVAKTRFATARAAREVRRGASQKPLHVTAAGLYIEEAVSRVRSMQGEHRIPTLLKRVDHLCRTTVLPLVGGCASV